MNSYFYACLAIMIVVFVLFLLTITNKKKLSSNLFGVAILIEIPVFCLGAIFTLCLGFFMQ